MKGKGGEGKEVILTSKFKSAHMGHHFSIRSDVTAFGRQSDNTPAEKIPGSSYISHLLKKFFVFQKCYTIPSQTKFILLGARKHNLLKGYQLADTESFTSESSGCPWGWFQCMPQIVKPDAQHKRKKFRNKPAA